MPYDVSVVGPLNIDLLIVGEGPKDWSSLPTWDGPAQMEMVAAGSVGYLVSDLAKLGLRVRVSSCVPDDALGTFIVDALQRDGVDTRAVRLVPGTVCGIGVYMLLFGSRKRPLIYRLPTHEPWPQHSADLEEAGLLEARLLHNGGYLHFQSAWHGATVSLFRKARQRGLLTSMDSQFPLFTMAPPWMRAMEDILPYVAILFCDETEARHLTAEQDLETCARILLEAGPELVVIKQGAEGATVFGRGWAYHQKAISLGEVVDTIGAGDAFDAGFLYGTLQGWPIEERALFAAIAAGYTVTGVGGSKTFPSCEHIRRVMAEFGR